MRNNKGLKGLALIVFFIMLGMMLATLMSSCGGMAMRQEGKIVLWDITWGQVKSTDKRGAVVEMDCGRVHAELEADEIRLFQGMRAESCPDSLCEWQLVEIGERWSLELPSRWWY